MNTMGKALTMIAGVLGLISLFIGVVLPDIGAWFKIEASAGGASLLGYYVNGLGIVSIGGSMSQLFGSGGLGILVIELIGGMVCLIGCIFCLLGAARESKKFSMIGAVLILLGPIILIIDLLLISSGSFALILQVFGSAGENILYGSLTVMGNTIAWGLWIGSFLALGAGILGVISSITL